VDVITSRSSHADISVFLDTTGSYAAAQWLPQTRSSSDLLAHWLKIRHQWVCGEQFESASRARRLCRRANGNYRRNR
jgi:hypothetical protein